MVYQTETVQQKKLRIAHNQKLARQDDTLVTISKKIKEYTATHTYAQLSRKSGDVTVSTLKRYRAMETARPNYSTLSFVARGLGFRLTLVPSN